VLDRIWEGVAIALATLRANKLRSFLTVLGVVIGVSTVMAMASLVQGVRTQVFRAIEAAGPATFYVMRFWNGTPIDPNNPPHEVKIRPTIAEPDAAALRRVPEIAYAAIWIELWQRIEHGAERTQQARFYAADERAMEILGGTLIRGRFFSPGELGGEKVVVLEAETVNRLFGPRDPLGQIVRVGGNAMRVIGVFRNPENVWAPPGTEIAGVIPFRTGKANFRYDEINSLFIAAKPRAGVDPARAHDLATVALRRARGLRVRQEANFDLITQDQLLATIDSLTSAFFLVMVILSGVALMVGGIGVMAIMMVSVTDRTREIGLRKAVGATRRAILWQFLVEAATLTLIGGLMGMLLGLGSGEVLKRALGIDAQVPLWSALLAVAASIGIGLVFGMVPANRAARLDPVEALRHE
jgi:putative ABC transport system permease protein